MKNFSKVTGVSLIEIVAAILLFALAAVPIYRSLSFGAAKEIDSEKVAIANRILESFKDEVLGLPYKDLEITYPANTWQPIGADFPNVFDQLLQAQQKYKDFQFSGEVRQVSGAVVKTMEFKSEVTWTNAYGKKNKPEQIFFIKVDK